MKSFAVSALIGYASAKSRLGLINHDAPCRIPLTKPVEYKVNSVLK